MACDNCKQNKAILLRPRTKDKVCKQCFFNAFEEEIHQTIIFTKMFKRGWRVGVGISGGKDSTVLAYVLNLLNKKYDYGVELVLLCVDEGIKGYRDNSISTVHQNQKDLGLQLEIVSYKEIFNTTMDDVVKKIGMKNNCTYCGVFRRQALEVAAKNTSVDIIVTGHNADDMAETVLLNFLRGDIGRLRRCTAPVTQRHVDEDGTVLSLPRAKPFKYTYQKEIVMYAYYKQLKYFSTECIYSPNAYRGDVRIFLKDLERIDSTIISKIVKSGDMFYDNKASETSVSPCKRCGHPTSSNNKICKGCVLMNNLVNL